jgi:negative regulator of sigma-B (phosphoserine phosphatase)
MAALSEHGQFELNGASGVLAWAATWRPKTDGAQCGDSFLVRRVMGSFLIAAIDGAGSGERAATAAAACREALVELPPQTNLDGYFAAAHQACRGTRGAALALALIEPIARHLVWSAIGDIDGLLVRHAGAKVLRRESILQRGGTIGYRLPGSLCQIHSIAPGDTLIFISDGIRQSFRNAAIGEAPVREITANIMKHHRRENDDAMVLATRIEEPT